MVPEEKARRYLKPDRDPPEAIASQARLVEMSCPVSVLDDLPEPVMILNRFRQMVWLNEACRRFLAGLADEPAKAGDALGKKPGEAFGCRYSNGPSGCGTTEFCRFCGTAAAIVNALDGGGGAETCVIQRDEIHGHEPLHLEVWSKNLQLEGQDLVLLIVRDRSGDMRRQVLERVFYHDVGNTVSGIRALLDLLKHDEPGQQGHWMALLDSATDQLIEEIESQKLMRSGDPVAIEERRELTDLNTLAEGTASLFHYALYSAELELTVETDPSGPQASTNAVLVRRCLVNMLKNAIEASTRGQAIRMGVRDEGSQALIWVWNAAAMDDEAKLRVFQHSFSTKGRGRGLGAYSLKLLAERYLGGRVWFTSGQDEGTTFYLRLPKEGRP